ncbi:MAG: PucR family transcriptional regulator, partial [Okeania sp. SIO3B3]|nr:PucR family transcriptional regulator [Okeania sp. SIO3B3]
PIIEIPSNVMFIDISEQILAWIINSQYALWRAAERINQQLTEVALRDADLHALAERLANILERSISIETTAMQVLATVEYGPVDEARRRATESGRTTSETGDFLHESGVYERLLREMRPIYIEPIPKLDMTMERIVAPIIVNREIQGYIWIIAGERPLNQLDELAIRHGATVAALVMLKEQAVRKAQESLKGDFFTQLLEDTPISGTVVEQAQRLNYNLDQPHQVVMLGTPDTAKNNLYEDVQHWLTQLSIPSLLIPREGWLVLVLEGYASVGQTVAQMTNQLSYPGRTMFAGVGKVTPKEQSLRNSYEQAHEALQITMALRWQSVAHFHELGMLHWLNNLSLEQRQDNDYLDYVRVLVQHDAERNTDLLDTLEAYIDCGGSIIEASHMLYVHRNTVSHRLERIQELCGLDLRSMWHRFNFMAAIKSYRLHG